jgi:hypothetical protein
MQESISVAVTKYLRLCKEKRFIYFTVLESKSPRLVAPLRLVVSLETLTVSSEDLMVDGITMLEACAEEIT